MGWTAPETESRSPIESKPRRRSDKCVRLSLAVMLRPIGWLAIACVTLGAESGCGGDVANDAPASGGGGAPSLQTTGGASSTTGGAPAPYCNGVLSDASFRVCTTQGPDYRSLNVLLVVDESRRMSLPADSTAVATEWSGLKEALSAVFAATVRLGDINQPGVNWGLELFPYAPGGIDPNSQDPSVGCAMPAERDLPIVGIADDPNNTTRILSVLDGQTPAGGTPTAQALRQAYHYFTQNSATIPNGMNFVALITNGAPDCNSSLTCSAGSCLPDMSDATVARNDCADNGAACLDDTATVSALEQLATAGIKTAVFGLPGSEGFADVLDRMAVAGGIPTSDGKNYYPVSADNYPQSLTDSLESFLQVLLPRRPGCDVILRQTPQSASDVIVVLDCTPISLLANNAGDAGGDGFYVDFSQVPPHLIFEGSPCAQLESPGIHQLDTITRCPYGLP